MRLNHSDPVLDFEGNPLQQQVGTPESPSLRDLTFRDAAVTALNNVLDGELVTAEAKARSYAISQKFYRSNKWVTLTVDELAYVKQRAGIILAQLVYGRICEWLEGHPPMLPADDEDEPTG